LLALLALEAGQVVSVQRILDEIWGEEIPLDPTNAVQARVSGLRKAIGPGVVVAYGGGYRLEVSPDAVDIVRFERGLAHGRDLMTGGDDEAAAHAFRACLELWRGSPLDGLAGLGFARDEATRLDELRLNAIEDCIDAELRLGRHAELTSELTELTRAHPFSEGFAAQLMLALYRCGRQIEALQVYRELSSRLLEEFGLEPGLRLRELESAILRQEPDLLLTAAPSGPMAARLPLGNLPTVPNSFVGRRDELARVRHLLAPGRLLTLTGPGGSGKTRLALEAAQAEVASTLDGVWLVELAPLAASIGLTTTVLRSLGVSESTPAPRVIDVPGVLGTSPEARLIDYLWDKQLLLVLDNCEHLIPDVAALVELILTRAPTVRVLATSREALDIDGETRLPIHPLEVPPVQASGGAQLEEYDAVRLFVDRARAVTPDFSIGDTTSTAVAAICRHLEGLPLALELAASQTRVLSAAQISGSLDQQFNSLVGGSRRTAPRHRTLQAAIDWSYERLEPGEQVLFESVSVFAGSFDIDAALYIGSAVGLSSREASELLARLIDKSLLVANTRTEVARYRLLEPLRLYGVSRLEQRGVRDEVRWQHAQWYLARAEAAEPEFRASPRQNEMAAEIERDVDNLRVAFDWLVERHDAARAQRLASALAWFSWMRGHERDGWLRLEAALELDAGGPATLERARASMWACHVATFAHELDAASARGYESLRTFAALGPGHSADTVLCTAFLVGVLFRFKHFEEGDALLADGQADATRADHWTQAAFGRTSGLGALWRGRTDEAERWFNESLAHIRACGDGWSEHRILFRLALIAERRGRYADAIRLCQQSLSIARRMTSDEGTANRLAQLGRLHLLIGDFANAEPLLLEALAIAGRIGATDASAEARRALGLLEAGRSNDHAAEALLTQAVEWFHRAAQHMEAVEALTCLGVLADRLGDTKRSYSLRRQALVEAIECADQSAEALALEGFAHLLAHKEATSAAVMLGSAQNARASTSAPAPPWTTATNEQTHEVIVRALGESRARDAIERGFRLSPQQVVQRLVETDPLLSLGRPVT
jgi:predicted ATPase/DNA-binding SARP family transcriptional activator